ncbi:MAG: signal peptidase I [Oscillospiraceae bacterium]|nr:signal peptidase I [Oscillospiraceae bacterium]
MNDNDNPENNPNRPSVEQINTELDRRVTWQEVKKAIIDTVKNLIVIAAAAVLVANLVISVVIVSRSSMNPTLYDGEVIVSLRWTSAKPGDIIVFYYNNNILMKRVIAKEGDWVNISDDGTVYVNEKALDEPYITEKSLGECDIEMPYQVPDGSVFVMGDNRKTSADSRLRDIGPVKTENIVGKAFLRIWPLTKISYIG